MTDIRLVDEGTEEPRVGESGPAATTTVTVRDLHRTFGSRAVLKGLDLDVGPGEVVALLGLSGCGKTTLLRVLGGLDHEATGHVEVPGARAVVYQEHRLLPWRRVWQNVGIALPRSQARPASELALDEVGLAGRADAWPNTLSGGEAARVALARALVREPQLLLLDEPFAVTHDVDEAMMLADRVAVMKNGTIAHDAAVGVARPRRRGDQRLENLRRQLLGELGVDDTV
jgi:sulfonate transport system ATP-binding protein